MRHFRALIFVCVFAAFSNSAYAQTKPPLSVERIFSTSDFSVERFGPARWLADGSGYTTVVRSQTHSEAYPEGYKNGSPISYAKNLKGDLLLVHGTGDDNVHCQGTQALINKLVEHDKAFDMMSYPNRSHGIYEGAGTTLHIRKLLTRYLLEHLEPGGKEVQSTPEIVQPGN